MKKIAIAALMILGVVTPVLGAGYAELNAGIDYYNQERYGDAITWLDKALAGTLTDDQKHVALVDRGIARLQSGDPQKAVDDLTAALAVAPNDDETREERAFAYVAAGQRDAAIADVDAINARKPNDPVASFQRGVLNWALERYPQASEAFAVSADTGNTYSWLWQQLANVKQGKPVTIYSIATAWDTRKYRDNAPTEWPGPIMALYRGDKDAAEVLADSSKANATEDKICEANFYVAAWQLVHGQTASARPLMAKAASDCPTDFVESRMARLEMKKLLP